MTTFELFVKRARIDLDAYFLANQITSDEQLRNYCLRNNIQPPEKKYFQKEDPQPPTVDVKPDIVEQPAKESAAPSKKPRERAKTTKTSKPRTTKRTTRKKS